MAVVNQMVCGRRQRSRKIAAIVWCTLQEPFVIGRGDTLHVSEVN